MKGLEPSIYEELTKKQHGLCAICKQPETKTRDGFVKQLALDHNHKTLEVRGLLCQTCNSAIGLLLENPALFLEAVNYLENSHTDVFIAPERVLLKKDVADVF